MAWLTPEKERHCHKRVKTQTQARLPACHSPGRPHLQTHPQKQMCVSMETPILHPEMVTTRMVRIRLKVTSIASTPHPAAAARICCVQNSGLSLPGLSPGTGGSQEPLLPEAFQQVPSHPHKIPEELPKCNPTPSSSEGRAGGKGSWPHSIDEITEAQYREAAHYGQPSPTE